MQTPGTNRRATQFPMGASTTDVMIPVATLGPPRVQHPQADDILNLVEPGLNGIP